MKKINSLLFTIIASLIISCVSNSSNEKNEIDTETQTDENNSNSTIDTDNTTTENVDDSEFLLEESEEENLYDCNYSDGTYSADVDYFNPETGYYTNYSLTVEVQDCQVVQINFPKGGWLDSDHIYPEDLDDSGRATIDGEDGKTFDVQIND